MMTRKELNAIKERVEKATPGPWGRDKSYVLLSEQDENGNTYICDIILPENEFVAEFIAHAREDIPKLLAEIERLRKLAIVLDYFLQEIDTHIRSTRNPMPYIKETMRKYFEFIMGGDDE